MAVGAGCSAPYRAPASQHGPTLTLVDSVRLLLPDSIAVGSRLHAARWGDRSFILGDIERYRVLVFDSIGRLARIFPTRTTEFGDGRESSAPYVLAGDTLVAVHDWWQKVLRVYRINDGRLAAEVPSGFLRQAAQYSVRGDTVYWGGVGIDFPSPVAQWIVGAPSVTAVGSSPGYLRSQVVVWVTYGWTGVVARASDLIVAVASEPGIRVLDPQGRGQAGVLVPAARRRGTAPGLIKRAARRRETNYFQPLGSILETLSVRPSGELILTYSDHDQVAPDSLKLTDSLLGNFHYYASVVSGDLSMACLDGVVPADSARGATLLWHGDQVDVLDQVRSGSPRKQLVIRRYRIDTAGCDWHPTGRWRP